MQRFFYVHLPWLPHRIALGGRESLNSSYADLSSAGPRLTGAAAGRDTGADMITTASIEQLINAVERLPSGPPADDPRVWYRTQKEK